MCFSCFRHDGIRVAISTQSPLTLPPELLELSTVAVCHGFYSRDWYTYLQSKWPFPEEESFEMIKHLAAGEALVFSPRVNLGRNLCKMAGKSRDQHDIDPVEADKEIMAEMQQKTKKNNNVIPRSSVTGPKTLLMKIRARLTEDRGASRTNK